MMKRQPSRVPSPTPTSFSGISNYKTDSYRPIRDKNVHVVLPVDYRLVSKTHYDELSRYLAAYLAKTQPSSRSSARQKLTRLTVQQFHELSTDVYDELIRRQNEKEVPFLPVRADFHPKRNQARQKLATLPSSRFEDLSSDVYFELSRRYPEFKDDSSGGPTLSSSYDDRPAPDFPNSFQSRTRTSGRTSADRPTDSGYGGGASRRPSEDKKRPSEIDFTSPGRRSEDSYRKNDDIYAGRTSEDSYASSVLASSASRKKPPQETTREHGRPSGALSISGTSDSMSTTNPNQSTTATSGMIIPNKSTIEEEYIEVPYGRDTDERDRSREASGEVGRLTDLELDGTSDYLSPRSTSSPPAGLSGLSARLQGVNGDDDERGRSGDDYYDKYGRSSVNSDRSLGNGMGVRLAGRAEDQDRMKRDYEYKIATMQTQISNLQRDLGDIDEKDRKLKDGEAKVRQMEEELMSLRRRAEEQSSTMRALQKDLDELRDVRQREKEREALRTQETEDELRTLRSRYERLEEEERGNRRGEADLEMIEQLRSDMEGLLTELGDLARRNDELIGAKDSDLNVIRDLDMELKDYKRKYEQAKTELRSVKATSQLYLQAPKFDRVDDQLPMSPDGGILDIHITAFLSAVDGLLTAGRSNAPTRVLTPMKSVVNAVSSILEDVRAFELRPQRERSDIDAEALRPLCERAEATLSNLVAASKTHATSSGLSPVSLLDAAASHVSVTITELARALFIRKATKAEQDKASHTPILPTAAGSFSPSLRSVEELRSSHQRKGSTTSHTSRGRFSESSSSSPNRIYGELKRRPPSDNSSSEKTNSPPPIFDQQTNSSGILSDDLTHAEGPEDAWSELKPYLEAQTESIVFAIQCVLSGVRSPTPPPTLNENLTQIITIVSSIVAVCNDNLPPASVKQGKETLRELSDHANRLSEVQALPDITKESRQIMAKSSFAIANAMKALTRL